MSHFQYLKIERAPTSQVVELLEENVIGTPGKSMLYKHHNVEGKLRNVPGAHYANLAIRERLYGTICLSKREVYSLGKKGTAYYLRYFTFRENLRSSASERKTGRSKSKIRQEVRSLMNGEGLNANKELLFYAYIDAINKRSKRLIDEYGFQQVGVFNIISFSRLFPKKSIRMNIADTSQEAMIISALQTYYQDFQLVSFENLFRHGNYFFIRDKDKIVCGVQAFVDQWDIINMPGIGGKILMHIVPKLPLLRKLFNPKFRFVMLDLAFCNEGYENLLSELFESALNYYKLNSGILCIDPGSKLYDIAKRMDLGIMHTIQGEKQIDIVAKDSKHDRLGSGLPFAVSGFDVL